MILVQVGVGLALPWGVALVSRVRLAERGRLPILTFIQLGAVVVANAQLVIMSVLWALAAFRAGETTPWITQAFNDTAWFMMLFLFVPVTSWVLAFAVHVFQDVSSTPTYPRWIGYLSLWVAVVQAPGPILVFFKQGVFAWSGLVPLYMPFGAFFVWFGVVSVYTIQDARRAIALLPK